MNGSINVTGGNRLKGSVKPVSNKNAILPALAASVLSKSTIVYHNVPHSSDVKKMLQIIVELGGSVDDTDYSEIKINCEDLKSYKVSYEIGSSIRSSVLFAGPLLARFGKAEIPIPGGCVLGKRSIAAHVDSFDRAGIKVEYGDRFAKFTAPGKIENEYKIWQVEASVTATENVFMYAAGTNSSFEISNAASEPHVTQLLDLLASMGAEISGQGSNKVYIKGLKELPLAANFTPNPDHIDIAGYIVAAAVTDGEITIKGANIPSIVDGMSNIFEKFNIKIDRQGEDLVVSRKGDLEINWKESGLPLAADGLVKITPSPWPGFPVDAFPLLAPLACKTKGQVLLKNWMYENALDFTNILNDLGANIYKSDAERVIVFGPVKFKGGVAVSPGIIRACKAIFLAALADPVKTTIHGTNILNRAYPGIFETYKSLGADIKIVS